jgi:hypothetical protein
LAVDARPVPGECGGRPVGTCGGRVQVAEGSGEGQNMVRVRVRVRD